MRKNHYLVKASALLIFSISSGFLLVKDNNICEGVKSPADIKECYVTCDEYLSLLRTQDYPKFSCTKEISGERGYVYQAQEELFDSLGGYEKGKKPSSCSSYELSSEKMYFHRYSTPGYPVVSFTKPLLQSELCTYEKQIKSDKKDFQIAEMVKMRSIGLRELSLANYLLSMFFDNFLGTLLFELFALLVFALTIVYLGWLALKESDLLGPERDHNNDLNKYLVELSCKVSKLLDLSLNRGDNEKERRKKELNDILKRTITAADKHIDKRLSEIEKVPNKE